MIVLNTNSCLPDWSEFLKARGCFYKATETQQFVGWIVEAHDRTVDVLAKTKPEAVVGETYLFQIFGSKRDLLFGAELKAKRPSELQVEGEAAEILVFSQTTVLRLESVERKVRRSAHGIAADLMAQATVDGDRIALQDLSPDGLGFVCAKAFRMGDQGDLTIHSEWGDIDLHFQVENCRQLGEDPAKAKYRVGVKISARDRISGVNWKRFVDAA